MSVVGIPAVRWTAYRPVTLSVENISQLFFVYQMQQMELLSKVVINNGDRPIHF